MELRKVYTTEHCYMRYPGQSEPQYSFLVLDTDDGTVRAINNGEIGNAVPARVWYGLDLRIPFDCHLTAGAINRLIDEIADNLQAILDGSNQEWDGSNWIGRFTDEATEALNRACAYAENFGDPDGDMLAIIDRDWFTETPREMARTCIERDCTPAALIDEILMEHDPDVVDVDTDHLVELIQAEIDAEV